MSKSPAAPKQANATRPPIAGELFLSALAAHGVDYFFCNPGTDFPPIIEGLAEAQATGQALPQA